MTPRRRSVLRGAGPLLLLLGGAVAFVVVVAAVFTVVGVRGGVDPDGARPEKSGVPASRPDPEPAATPARRDGDRSANAAGAGPAVRLAAASDGAVPQVVDRLPEGSVLVVTATGFPPGGTADVAQCRPEAGSPQSCTNRFPVQFDADGTARFQYLVTDRVWPSGRCGAGDPPCLLVVGPSDDTSAAALTVFRDAAPAAGRIAVEPASGLLDGDVVTVRATGFPAGTPVVARQCPAPSTGAAGPCRGGAEGRTGPGGDAVLRLPVRAGEGHGIRCGPGTPCAVTVVAEAAVAPVSAVVRFSAGPSARLDPGRVAAGLAVAALFLALAGWLVRTTDWRRPLQAATPEMDEAVFEA